ncbi:MAG: lysylphosphatidylglycerol synthase transmembrane domain-containing protein [Bowdeniella nasicola]|nr:lysylphosphatidylglycerol synthase transmembrane domain-containing protein [Bowdeniella nasicola]
MKNSREPSEVEAISTQLTPDQLPGHPVQLIDSPERIIRRPKDGLRTITTTLAMVLVALMSIYAHGTTAGVTEDVYSAVARTARQILLVPVNVAEGLVVMVVPLAVLLAQIVRRRWRATVLIIGAGVAAALLAQGAVSLLEVTKPNALAIALSLPGRWGPRIVLSSYIAALASILTMAHHAAYTRVVRPSWYALAAVLALAVIQGDQSLPGALITVLLGRMVAFALAYTAGIQSARAWGASLIRGIRRTGIDPWLVVRLDDVDDLQAWQVSSSSPLGYVEGQAAATSDGLTDLVAPDPLVDAEEVRATLTEQMTHPRQLSAHRSYAVFTDAEHTHRYDVLVLDAEQQVLGVISSMWDSVRNRGLERRFAPSVRESAERAILMTSQARRAGVRTPEILATAQAETSIILPFEPQPKALPLCDLKEGDLPEWLLREAFRDVWHQLLAAHRRGLAHHEISGRSILVDDRGRAYLNAWDDAELASSDLARRLDLAQLLTLTALHLGQEEALAMARAEAGDDAVVSIASLLQKAALPAVTRSELRHHRDLLPNLREALVDKVPEADATPMRLERVSLKSLVMVTIAVLAIIIVLGSLQLDDVLEAVRSANPWWMVAAFVCGLLTYVGSAIGLVAFTPEKIGIWRTTLVQVAASIVSLVAPAGIGPAAMDLRFLTKARVPAPLAAATVALTQASRFVITVALLVIVALGSGSAGSVSWPELPTIITLAGVLAAVATLFAFPQVRAWVMKKIGPTLRQIWPRLLWALGSPKRLGIAVAGNIIMTVGYVAAFGFALLAFGYTLSPITLAITFLVSNSAGSVVPSPGGIGPVEVALTSGLTLAGIPYATALSVTIVYRLLTFWGRVPLGWWALRHLEKTNVI